MVHTRIRCAYCDDSRGADVDHFAPINHDYTRTFSWDNHLWSCPECNRRKSTRFPVVDGEEMLLNPVIEDWWEPLTLDSSSGVVAPKFDASGAENARGRETLNVFAPLTWESVVEGRYRAIAALKEAVELVLAHGDSRSSRQVLGKAVREDDYGVTGWFALGPGMHESPFAELRAGSPAIWRRFVRAAVADQYGDLTE
jgi:hypothetical protein